MDQKEYDFNTMKAQKNPYVKELKTQITIRIDRETVEYFKALAKKTGMSYQNLMNLYLRECAQAKMEPTIKFRATAR